MVDHDVFTEREQRLMALAWQCFADQPKMNFDKLAQLGGYTNVRSASNAWSAIKKKLASQAAKAAAGTADGDGHDDAAGTPKATPKKRGKKATDADDADETPAKKTKGRTGNATTPQKKAESDEENGEDGAAIKAEAGSDGDSLS